MEIISVISLVIGSIGVIIIIWGAFVSVIQLCFNEARVFSGDSSLEKRNLIRQGLGSYLLMGLEYMIGADIVRTLIRPTLRELAILGAMVTIRTVISFFLNREMGQGSKK